MRSEPTALSDAERLHTLGLAVSSFVALEWEIIWLTEALDPGSVEHSDRAPVRLLAQRFEHAVQNVKPASAELLEMSNRFGQLALQRDLLLQSHPRSWFPERGVAPDRVIAGRKVWSAAEVLTLAGQFQEAAREAGELLREQGRRYGLREEPKEPASASLSVLQPDADVQQSLRAAVVGVCRRLESNSAAKKMAGEEIDMYVVPNFLEEAQCDALIGMMERGRRPSTLLSQDPEPGFRTSESCDLPVEDPAVKSLDARISELLGIPPAFGEAMQGQRYAKGQEFKPHHDFFYTDQYYWDEMDRQGGQRTWTAMLYLNRPDLGGATNFPNVGIKIEAEKGTLLVWSNLDRNGQPNPATLHQGTPVDAGLKFVITKWYRARPWTAETLQ
jgi:prolyl 4-hydroxylase